MKNIPRLFMGDNLSTGDAIPVDKGTAHYLMRVMRTNQCLAFGGGREFVAVLSDDGRVLNVGEQTVHNDPSNDLTLMFAPIKRTDDLLNMATQLGVATFQPVITERTNANHVNWTRMVKIVVEAAEQSNRNSVPKILPPKKFCELDLSKIVFADERVVYGREIEREIGDVKSILVGPEGGFSDAEFEQLDAAGARGMSLGKTILRAELAAAIAVARVIK